MKKKHIFLTLLIVLIQPSFSQELKDDARTQLEKEDPFENYNPNETSMLDLLEALETQGIIINKFEFGKFDKQYDIVLLSDRYDNGILIKTDTLVQFESTYRYPEGDKQYYNFIDKIKIITKDDNAQSELYIKTYNLSSVAKIELKRTSANSHFQWRRYKKTDWELNKKVPLMVFASSWKDEKYGFDRFCGVSFLTNNGKETNELLALSPSYAVINYHVTER